MNTKHTSGPWKWVGNDLEQVGGEYKTVIGLTVGCGQFCYGGSVEMTASEDDLRLIAAAPELLEALIALRKAELEDDSSDVSIALLRDMADAAITKATGA